jgi:hypothetical protein
MDALVRSFQKETADVLRCRSRIADAILAVISDVAWRRGGGYLAFADVAATERGDVIDAAQSTLDADGTHTPPM